MADDFTLSPSTLAFLSDRAIRAALIQLVGEKSIPDDIGWADIPTYYRARIAVHQFLGEWGLDGYEMWHEVWGKVIRAPWVAMSPAAQSEEEFDLFPPNLYANENPENIWFGRVFRRDDHYLYTSITALPDQGVVALVQVGNARGNTIDVGRLGAVQNSLEYWMSEPSIWNSEGHLSLSELKAMASNATRVIDEHFSH